MAVANWNDLRARTSLHPFLGENGLQEYSTMSFESYHRKHTGVIEAPYKLELRNTVLRTYEYIQLNRWSIIIMHIHFFPLFLLKRRRARPLRKWWKQGFFHSFFMQRVCLLRDAARRARSAKDAIFEIASLSLSFRSWHPPSTVKKMGVSASMKGRTELALFFKRQTCSWSELFRFLSNNKKKT